MHELGRELETALAAVHKAGKVVMRLYACFERIADAPADISTFADRESQNVIFEQLQSVFPDDRLCGEESTAIPNVDRARGGRIWIVDPIDGTRGFARKNDEFSIMIGLVNEKEVQLGVVYEPAIDRVTFAARGGGCWLRQPFDARPIRCRVANTDELSRAIMSVSRSQGPQGRARLQDAFGVADLIETYSAGIKLAQVARGETDLYLGDYLTLKDWDVCAGHMLVEAAGGAVTNVFGDPIHYYGSGKSLRGKGLLATNGRLHGPALAVLRANKYSWS
jgi:3'(2'), 5'-bisphosphate nucleotidase